MALNINKNMFRKRYKINKQNELIYIDIINFIIIGIYSQLD